MTNPKVCIYRTQVLSDHWYTPKKMTYDYHMHYRKTKTYEREAYDRRDGASILLYKRSVQSAILTGQFRLPTSIHANYRNMMIEASAGLSDVDNLQDGIKKETVEETGYKIKDV